MCVSRYSDRSSGLWTAGFERGFFSTRWIHYTHTLDVPRMYIAVLTPHRGGFGVVCVWGEWLKCGTVRVEWLVLKSSASKQIFIR